MQLGFALNNSPWLEVKDGGYCFLAAGWRRLGWTKGGHGRDPLLVLVKDSPNATSVDAR